MRGAAARTALGGIAALGCVAALAHCYWLTSYEDLTRDDGVDASGTIPTPPGGPWQLVFDDEFDGSSLDTVKWATQYDRPGDRANSDTSNGESEWYLADNVSASGGVLSLSARKQSYTSPDSGAPFDFTSGMITSKPSFQFEMGYAEARVRLPKGSGFRPSFWMWPYDESSTPEIDVAAFYGNDVTKVECTLHPEGGGAGQGIDEPSADWTADWHVFALDRESDGTTWTIDGSQVLHTGPAAASLYLIFTLAISNGQNAPAPDGSTVFPSALQIDWVRVFRHP